MRTHPASGGACHASRKHGTRSRRGCRKVCHVRVQHPCGRGGRRADHAADPRPYPRQARRRLYGGADPGAGPRAPREVSRPQGRSFGPARAIPPQRRDGSPAELRVRRCHALRVGQADRRVFPSAAAPDSEAVLQSQPADHDAPPAVAHQPASPGARRPFLRSRAQPGRRDDPHQHRRQERPDAGRVGIRAARLQRAPGSRARGCRAVPARTPPSDRTVRRPLVRTAHLPASIRLPEGRVCARAAAGDGADGEVAPDSAKEQTSNALPSSELRPQHNEPRAQDHEPGAQSDGPRAQSEEARAQNGELRAQSSERPESDETRMQSHETTERPAVARSVEPPGDSGSNVS